MRTPVTDLLGISEPIIQAPMAGTSTPALAAAVCNAGALGSLGLASTGAEGCADEITRLQAATNRPFNVNFFVNRTPERDPAREARWMRHLAGYVEETGAEVPKPDDWVPMSVSLNDDDDVLDVLLATKPPVISFHFGLPDKKRLEALRSFNPVMMASATTVEEARRVEGAGLHAIVAQGFEAGGHRGIFDERQGDRQIGTMALVPMIAGAVSIPVVAAGGIADGRGIAACLALGAGAAQMGTAFITCEESAANQAYRSALMSDRSTYTVVTDVISGRPARGLTNRYIQEMADKRSDKPDFPVAYHPNKAIAGVAADKGIDDFTAMWCGQAAALNRPMAAADLVARLAAETRAEIARLAGIAS